MNFPGESARRQLIENIYADCLDSFGPATGNASISNQPPWLAILSLRLSELGMAKFSQTDKLTYGEVRRTRRSS